MENQTYPAIEALSYPELRINLPLFNGGSDTTMLYSAGTRKAGEVMARGTLRLLATMSQMSWDTPQMVSYLAPYKIPRLDKVSILLIKRKFISLFRQRSLEYLLSKERSFSTIKE
nr:hypothetical protein [Lactococcus lactis]